MMVNTVTNPRRPATYPSSMNLRRGEFFGREVATGQVGDFALSLTRYEAGTSIPWHVHDETYVTFVMNGGYREPLSGVTRDCRIPTALVQPAAAPQFAGRLGRELNRRDASSPMVIEGLMLELFAETARQPDERRVPAWLRSVRETIVSRFRERLSLASLAAAAGVHPTHLARAFRQHYGCTIGELQRELRVEYAMQRMSAGDTPCEVAADAGFADQSHLTRTFRAISGSTPAAYRREARRTTR